MTGDLLGRVEVSRMTVAKLGSTSSRVARAQVERGQALLDIVLPKDMERRGWAGKDSVGWVARAQPVRALNARGMPPGIRAVGAAATRGALPSRLPLPLAKMPCSGSCQSWTNPQAWCSDFLAHRLLFHLRTMERKTLMKLGKLKMFSFV